MLGLAAAPIVLAAATQAPSSSGPGMFRNWTVSALAKMIDGHVRVGSLSVSVLGSIDARDVVFTMPDGSPAIRAERLRARFSVTDILRKRYRFSSVTLVSPVVVLAQAADGHWNLEHLFRLQHQPAGPHGRRPLVDLRNVVIGDGTITIRERLARDSVRVRVLSGVSIDLARLRPSHPDSAAIVGTLRKLAARLDHPALVVQDTRGDFSVDGNRVHFALDHVVLPQTQMAAAGTLTFGGAHVALDADVNATRFAFADLRGVAPSLPRDGTGRARLHARLGADGSTAIELADGEFRSGRTVALARGTFAASATGQLTVRDADLRLQPLDLALIKPFVDSLPIRGLLRGRVQGSGALADLAVDANLDWIDERTAGSPTNHVTGRGRLAIGGRDQLAFRGFTTSRADFDLGTIRHFAPSVLLVGRLHAQGTFNGPYRRAQFNGSIRHTGPDSLASALHGALRLGLADTLQVDADLVVDSLSLDLLRLTYPQIPLHDVLRGRAALHGPLTALAVNASLWGPVGVVQARGTIGVHESDVTLALAGTFDSLDLRRFQAAAPPTALSGAWHTDLRVPLDSASAAVGTARVDSMAGSIAGVLVADGTIPVRFEPDRMSVDQARLAFNGGYVTVNGGLGRAGRDASMELVVRADTLGYLEPLLRWARHETGDTSSVRLEGAGRIDGRVSGTTDAWTIDAELSMDGMTVAGSTSRALRGRGRLAGGDHGYAVAAQLSAGQFSIAGLDYAPVELNVQGPLDSVTVQAAAGFTPGASARAQVTIWGDSALRLVRVDSMQLKLPVRTWSLAAPGTVRLAADGLTFDTLELHDQAGTGFLRVEGVLPLRGGVADFTLAFDSLSMVDIYTMSQGDASGIRGALNGTLRIAGPVETPTMEARVALSDGGFTDYRLPLVQVLARYTDQRLTLKGGLWQGDEQFVTINGSLPLDLSLQAVALRRLPGEISIVAKADSLDMAALAPLTDLLTRTSGRMGLDVRIGGTWDDSRLSGFVDIVDGAMTIPALGAHYAGIDARFELADSTVRVVRGALHGGNGVLALSGHAVFTELAHPRLDLTLQMSRFAAFDIADFGSITGSGTLHLRGRFPASTLTGGLTVDAGYLQFADLVQKRIVSLNDPEFRALVDSNLAQATDLAPGAVSIFLDSLRVDSVAVTLGNDVWLRSSEANIQLAGDFVVDRDIQGNLPRYRLDGTMRAVRGTYRLALGYVNSPIAINKEFRVTRGTVRFFGTPDFNPEMDIVAENTVRPVSGGPLIVRVLIGGTLRYPRLTLESDAQPPLTQTEIVSYLMFGRPPSSGTGSEASLLASVLGSAIGGVGQALVSELGLPLSYLTIVPGSVTTSEGMATTRIEAGVQVGDHTFLTLNAGLCEVLANQLPGAGVEYRFNQRWTLAAAFEPVVQSCGTAAYLAGVAARYQFGIDLNWQMGIR